MDDQIVFPKNLVLTAKLASAGKFDNKATLLKILAIVSVIYLVLSTIGIIYYFRCLENATTLTIWITARYMYMQDPATCEAISPYNDSHIMQPHVILYFMAITLGMSAVNLVTSMLLFRRMSCGTTKYAAVFIYAYVGSWFATLIVDLTLGTLLGLDITYLANLMEENNNNNIGVFLMRKGAIYMMTIALKGYVIQIMNFALIIILLIYLIQDRRGEIWTFQNATYVVETATHAFNDTVNNYYRKHETSFDGRNNSAPGVTKQRQYATNPSEPRVRLQTNANLGGNQHPFSYLEEPRIPAPKEGVASGWRNTLAPPVPLEDRTPPMGGRNTLAPPVRVLYRTPPMGWRNTLAAPVPLEDRTPPMGGRNTLAPPVPLEDRTPPMGGCNTLAPPVPLEDRTPSVGGRNTLAPPEPLLDDTPCLGWRNTLAPPVRVLYRTPPMGWRNTLAAPVPLEDRTPPMGGRNTLAPPAPLEDRTPLKPALKNTY